jgi:hypothetical protein
MLPKLGIKKLLLQSWDSVLRFPLSLFCAVAAFVMLSVRNHFFMGPAHQYFASHLTRLALTALAGISLFFAFHFYSENKKLDNAKKLGLVLLGLCLLGLHYYSVPNDYYNYELNYTLRFITILICFHLVVSFCVYNTSQDISAFWKYNETLFVQLLQSALFSAVLCIGLQGALYAIEKLFKLSLSINWYYDILFASGIVFNTLFFLYNMPEDSAVWHKPINYTTPLRIFVQYICIPLCILYAVILGAYLIQSLVQGKLPKGAVALPILSFAAISAFTYLLAYPIKDGEYFWIRKFCTYVFYVLLPYAIFELGAVMFRVRELGLTENRYLAIALGLWLVGLCIYMIVSKPKNITWIPISLALIFAVASIGKVGMYATSARSQLSRLLDVLQRNNMIIKGKLQVPEASKHYLTEADKQDILASIKYLYTRGELQKLYPLLNLAEQKEINRLVAEGYNETNFGKLFGVQNVDMSATSNIDENAETITFVNADQRLNSSPLQLNGMQHLLQFDGTDYKHLNIEEPILDPSVTQSLLRSNVLTMVSNGDTLVKRNLDKVNKVLAHYLEVRNNDSSFFGTIGRLTLPFSTLSVSRDSLCVRDSNCTFYLDEIHLNKQGSSYFATYARGFILW